MIFNQIVKLFDFIKSPTKSKKYEFKGQALLSLFPSTNSPLKYMMFQIQWDLESYTNFLFLYLFIYLSIYLFIYLFIYFFKSLFTVGMQQ